MIFEKWVARHCLKDIDIVWGFDTSSLKVFEEAKQRNIKCILDMSIAHPLEGEAILHHHAARRPEYAACFGHDRKSKEEIESRKREMELADVIVAPSHFVRRSLEKFDVPSGKIIVNPFGVDIGAFRMPEDRERTDILRFLYVGQISQRKGVYYALEAWEKSGLKGRAEFLFAGGDKRSLQCWKGPLPEGVRMLGRISYSKLPDVYRKSHVFIFPSLFEGFALVIFEAMASGLPVIMTDYLAEGLVEHDVEGLLVPAGNIDLLAEAMMRFAGDPSLIDKMGKAARRRAEEFTWSAYGDRCAAICRDLYQGKIPIL